MGNIFATRFPHCVSHSPPGKMKMRRACLLFCVFVSSLLPAAASERAFPFDRELMLDVAPMPGSKRVPILEIDANGAASIDLWCASTRGQANVGEDSISIVPGPTQPVQCAPDRQSGPRGRRPGIASAT